MSNNEFLNNDIDNLKRKVANILGISLQQLEEEIKKIKIESRGMAGDRTALLILLDRTGYIDRQIFEKVMIGNPLTPISELRENVRSATILARIMRIFPEQISRKNTMYRKVLIDDGTGQAFLLLFGEAIKEFDEKGFKIGDPILIRRVRVRQKIGDYLTLISHNETRFDHPKENYEQIIRSLPDPPITLNVNEILESMEIFDDGDEVNLVGLVDGLSDYRTFQRKDGSEGKVINIFLLDREKPNRYIRIAAWDKLADYIRDNLIPGEIIGVYGGRIKKTLDNYGNTRIEVNLTRLSSVVKMGEKTIKIREANDNVDKKVVIYAYSLETPDLRSFERNGLSSNYAIINIIDDTARMRVVIWDEEIIENIKDVAAGTPLRLYGKVRDNSGRLELHLSHNGNIIVNPKNFPIKEEFDKLKEETETRIQVEETFSDFSEILDERFVNLIGVIEYIEISSFEKMPSTIILGDEKGNRVKIIGWRDDIFQEIQKWGLGTRVKITSLMSDRDRISGESVFKITQKTNVEKMGESPKSEEFLDKTVEFVDAKTMLEQIDEKKKYPLLRDMDKKLDESKVIGSIISIMEVSVKSFCEICGSPMIDNEGICESGHIAKGESEKYATTIIDDGEESYEAIVKESAFSELYKDEKTKELIDLENEIKKIMGKELLLTVSPKIKKNGKMYLIVKKIEEIPYQELLEIFYNSM